MACSGKRKKKKIAKEIDGRDSTAGDMRKERARESAPFSTMPDMRNIFSKMSAAASKRI